LKVISTAVPPSDVNVLNNVQSVTVQNCVFRMNSESNEAAQHSGIKTQAFRLQSLWKLILQHCLWDLEFSDHLRSRVVLVRGWQGNEESDNTAVTVMTFCGKIVRPSVS